jgi:hypothetical protein
MPDSQVTEPHRHSKIRIAAVRTRQLTDADGTDEREVAPADNSWLLVLGCLPWVIAAVAIVLFLML